MGILLFELFRNPLFMGILNKWETLVIDFLRRSVEIRRITGLKYVNIGFLSCYSLFRPVR